MIDSRAFVSRASELVQLDAEGRNITAAEAVAQIMAEFGVTKGRAEVAVARAARLARYQRTAEDDDEMQMTKILRIKVSDRQFELLSAMAAEAGTDMSKLVRRKMFAQ
jgi:hypothetical protein